MAEQIPKSPTDWGTVAQWVLAVLTLLAVVVALLKEEIVKLWRRPKLVATIKLSPPDSHKTYWRYIIPETPLVSRFADCYFLRLWVRNLGNVRAEKVQVFAEKLSKRIVDGTFIPVRDFMPMNLCWAHTNEIFAEGISPLMGRHCDLGHITFPGALVDLQEDHPDAPQESTILALNLEVKPNTKNHLVLPGTYRLVLKIAATNSPPVTKTLEITLTGTWYDDQEKMFSDGIGIRTID